MNIRSIVRSLVGEDAGLVQKARTKIATFLDPNRPYNTNQLIGSERAYQDVLLAGEVQSAMAMPRGSWGCTFSPSGIMTGFVYKCRCGTSRPYPDNNWMRFAEGQLDQCDNKSCADGKPGSIDFVRDTHIRIASIADDSLEMKAITAISGGQITAADYLKHPDGTYWLVPSKQRALFSTLPQVPDTTVPTGGSSPMQALPVGEGEVEVEYSQFNPGVSGAGFGTGFPPTNARARAQMREERYARFEGREVRKLEDEETR